MKGILIKYGAFNLNDRCADPPLLPLHPELVIVSLNVKGTPDFLKAMLKQKDSYFDQHCFFSSFFVHV